eukprot:g5010.t1
MGNPEGWSVTLRTLPRNLLRSYPKELLHTYEAYHRDDGSDVPMSQLVNKKGPGFDGVPLRRGRSNSGKFFPKWRPAIPLSDGSRGKARQYADGFHIGEKPPLRCFFQKEAGGKKHRVEGWVRLASFMPIESLLGPCEFSQDTMSKASREKILKVKDATPPTGVFPEGESCNIWWPKDCPPSPPPPPPPPSSSSSSSSTTTTTTTTTSTSSSSSTTSTTTTTTAAFGQASEIPSDVQDEVAKLMQEKAAKGKAAAAAATTTTSRGGKRTIVAEKNKAAKRSKTTPTAKGSDAQECSPSEAVPEELAEEKEKSSNEEEGPCHLETRQLAHCDTTDKLYGHSLLTSPPYVQPPDSAYLVDEHTPPCQIYKPPRPLVCDRSLSGFLAVNHAL